MSHKLDGSPGEIAAKASHALAVGPAVKPDGKAAVLIAILKEQWLQVSLILEPEDAQAFAEQVLAQVSAIQSGLVTPGGAPISGIQRDGG